MLSTTYPNINTTKTFYGEGIAFLECRGFSREQASQVMLNVINSKECDVMSSHWGESIEGYSPAMLSILYSHCKHHGLKYIEKHIPHAWFRPMFNSESN